MLSFEMKTMKTLLVLSFMLVEARLLYINERSGQENLADLTYDNMTMNLYNVTEISLEYSDGGTVSLLERVNGSETDATSSESDEVFKETKRMKTRVSKSEEYAEWEPLLIIIVPMAFITSALVFVKCTRHCREKQLRNIMKQGDIHVKQHLLELNEFDYEEE